MTLDQSLVRSHWHLVGHRCEMPAPGDFLRFETAAGDIVVFHDGAGLVAFDNRCPHRGALMYQDTHGNQPATCRYHGWTHSAGRLIVPQPERFAGCDIGSARLRQFATAWCGDFLFVGIEPLHTLDEQLQGTAEVLENISFNVARRRDFNHYRYECHWPLAVENALEPYHIGLVHPQTLATLALEDGQNVFHGVNSVWYAPVGNARMRKQLGMLKRFFMMDFGYEGYMSVYLFPFTMLSSTYGFSYSLQHFMPAVDGSTTAFSSRLLTAHVVDEQAEAVLRPFFESTAQVNRRVFDEDHQVCRRMPPDAWSPEPLRFSADNEAKIVHFRQSCREHLARQCAAPDMA